MITRFIRLWFPAFYLPKYEMDMIVLSVLFLLAVISYYCYKKYKDKEFLEVSVVWCAFVLVGKIGLCKSRPEIEEVFYNLGFAVAVTVFLALLVYVVYKLIKICGKVK